MSGLSPTKRYYAVSPAEQKRRSFWRKSIKPDEIGVAVSPNVVEEASSPASFSSQQSMLALLPKVPAKLPGQLLWPAPLNLHSSRRERPLSDTTVFDEDVEAQPTRARISEARDSSSVPGLKHQTTGLAPLNLYHGMPDLNDESQRGVVTRIPLTPTYDNGNVGMTRALPHGPPPSSWHQPRKLSSLNAVQPLTALRETRRQLLDEEQAEVLQDPAIESIQTGQVKTHADASPPSVRPATRKDSESTIATDIEDDITSEEQQSSQGSTRLPKNEAGSPWKDSHVAPALRSPISNVTYPTVPRSVATSRHVEVAAAPRGVYLAPPPRKGLSRDALIRNESSFIATDTTSSDGHMSNQSIEWPAPPRSSSLKNGMMRLRENQSGAHRLFGKPGASLGQVLTDTANNKAPLQSHTTPQAKLEPTPSLSKGQGEIYFTVEL